jgi:hypothetical protein
MTFAAAVKNADATINASTKDSSGDLENKKKFRTLIQHLNTKRSFSDSINGISLACFHESRVYGFDKIKNYLKSAESARVVKLINPDDQHGNIGAKLSKSFQLTNSESDTGSFKEHSSRLPISFQQGNKKFNVLINHLKSKKDNIDFINGISKVCSVDCHSNGYGNVTAYLISAEDKGLIHIIDRDNRDGNIGAQLIQFDIEE